MKIRTRTTLLTLALVVAAPAAAHADITGTATNPAGVPVPDMTITVKDSGNGFVTSERTEPDGTFRITSADLSGDPAPYTLEYRKLPACRAQGEATTVEGTAGPVADGAVQNLSIPVFDMCAADAPFDAPPPTGFVDRLNRLVLSPPGGLTYIEAMIADDAQNLEVLINGGAVIGTAATGDKVAITAPASGYSGPMALRYTSDAVSYVRNLGTLHSAAVGPAPAATGPIDISAIVDVSGSMAGTDPLFIRKDAVSLLVDLATQGDKVGAVGFDDAFLDIFGLTPITGNVAVSNNLKRLARERIENRGGTDYNVAFDAGFGQLAGADASVPKAAIFLTDGGHNSGQYQNGHLRLAHNVSGRPWPACAIQLGDPAGFDADDVARLRRIASETGGQYFAARTAGELTSIYFRCFGRATGQRTLFNKAATYRQGQKRAFKKRIARRTKEATFFVGWGNGTYDVSLRDPRGKRRTGRRPGRGATFRRGGSYAFFRVRKPRAGRWTVQVKARKLPGGRDRARTTITAPKR